MARKRSISIEFWCDPKIVTLSRDERLMFLGLISNANDYGKLRGEAYIIKSKIFPNDDISLETLQQWLTNLHNKKLILSYPINGEVFIKLLRWEKNQTISHPSLDEYPDPPDTLWRLSGDLPPEDKRSKEKLREVKLSEVEEKLREYMEQNKFFKPIPLKEEFIQSITEAFPNRVVINELKKMSAWLIANPAKHKKDYKRFIVNWLNREKKGDQYGTNQNNGNASDGEVRKKGSKYGHLSKTID